MAIGLKDLKKGAQAKGSGQAPEKVFSPHLNLEERTPEAPLEATKKVLRPWESFEQMGEQTRTLRAKEAVRHALERTATSTAKAMPNQARAPSATPYMEEELVPPPLPLDVDIAPLWKRRGPAGPWQLFFYFLKI